MLVNKPNLFSQGYGEGKKEKGWSKNINGSRVDGFTLYDALDSIVPPERPVSKPLRLPIEDVYNIEGIGRVAVGKSNSVWWFF